MLTLKPAVLLPRIIGDTIYNMSQNTQAVTNEFCYLEEVEGIEGWYRPITHYIRCRDIFTTAFMASMLNSRLPRVHGFETEYVIPIKDPILGVRLSVKELKSLVDNLKYLWEVEDEAGLVRTSIKLCNSKNISRHLVEIVLEFDKAWFKNVAMLSLYTFLIRVLSRKSSSKLFNSMESIIRIAAEDNNGNDSDYCKCFVSTKLKISTLVVNHSRVFDESPITGLNDNILLPSFMGNVSGGICANDAVTPEMVELSNGYLPSDRRVIMTVSFPTLATYGIYQLLGTLRHIQNGVSLGGNARIYTGLLWSIRLAEIMRENETKT